MCFALGTALVLALGPSAVARTGGAKLWVTRYNGPANGFDLASSVAASPDGSKVFVTGSRQGSTSHRDYATVAYNAVTGSQLWVRRYKRNAFGSSVAVSPDGSKVFVTGYDPGSASSDYATLAYDASTGATLWVRRYNGPGNGEDDALSVAVSPDGSKVFVTGGSLGTTGSDAATVAYGASTGAPLWVRRYNGPANAGAGALSVAASPAGSKVFITGTSVGTTTGNVNDYVTVAYEA